ncbi:Actin/actin-like protein [Lepidopterella palustris CBS 459.81]|uniref:Actin-like protein ARP6 n=1 Tax=Lepidopterella palustris CBS 459.81 TaxID=1314670 RepID=A0A8E2ELS5_9PEZI|nr:Actin/actin-like protein [Lepidopterella palustris CBS 459.81]
MPPKGSKKVVPDPIAPKTLILDNGAYTIKAGLSSPDTEPNYEDCKVIPNCIARSRDKRVYIASELEKCVDFGEMAFRRPVERGFIVNWEAEKAIWEQEFLSSGADLRCDPKETNLILTEAPNCPAMLQKNCDEMVFEQFEFASYYRCIGPALNAYNDIRSLFSDPPPPPHLAHLPPECLLLIDTSYSHTTITPLYNGRPIQPALLRLSVGGKVLTNYLKEIASIRHYNMLDETYLLNEIKEAVSFVSPQFSTDLERTWKGGLKDRRPLDPSIVVDYVLPDYETRSHGFARPHDPVKAKIKRLQPQMGLREDILPLGNERFAVPELLFSPTDIGMQEAGLPECVMQSLSSLPPALQAGMLANVVVVGGNSLIDGFMERLTSELRGLAPSNFPVRIERAPDPIKHTWLGGARLASSRELLKSVVVTKADYLEHGSTWLGRQFLGGAGAKG